MTHHYQEKAHMTDEEAKGRMYRLLLSTKKTETCARVENGVLY